MKLEYSHYEDVDEIIKVRKYYFTVKINKRMHLTFYTYKDLSGYGIDFGTEEPEDLIFIGTAILTNLEFIKSTIKELLK